VLLGAVSNRHRLTEQHTKVQTAAKAIKEQLTGLSGQRQDMDKPQQDKINKLLQDFAAILQVCDGCSSKDVFNSCQTELQRLEISSRIAG
jgi:hypothetical protein